MEKLEHTEITEKIIGSAMKVHSTLGNACLAFRQGFQRVIYQRCLAIEMEKNGLGFEIEQEQTIFYDGVEVGTRRVYFLVENKILVEIKALINLENVHLAQAINYLEAFGLKNDLLINFGATKLEFKRLYNNHIYIQYSFNP